MVAPISVNRPTRVFSRLPYTGEDKSLPAVCCDLSRTASIAPAHPLPRALPATDTLKSLGGKRPAEDGAAGCTTKKIKLSQLDDVSAIVTENEKLKHQNEVLRRKLLAFQMIMREEANYNLAVVKVKEMDQRNRMNVV